MRSGLAALVAFAILFIATSASAEPKPRASFAIVIGSNTSVDANVTPLHYADDDAARYFDFFRLLGTKVTLSEAIPTEPAVCDANEYVLKLTVTDCTGAAVSDTVTYTVNCCGIEAAAAR